MDTRQVFWHNRNKAKMRMKAVLANLMRYFMLLVTGFIVLYPLFFMASSSVKTKDAFLDVSYQWFPVSITMEHFKTALEVTNFWKALVRTLSLQIVSCAIEVVVCSFIAYGFARFNFKGKKLASFFLILSLLVPVQMYGLSLSVNYRNLDIFGVLGLLKAITGVELRPNILNTSWTYYLPSLLGVGIRSGMMIYIYQQFFVGLPKELEEAAYVDGAGPIRTYIRIALPSSGVAILTVSVLSFIWHWNEYYLAVLCFLDDNRPLSITVGNITAALQQIGIWQGSNPIYTAIVFAACIMFISIPLLLYMIVQRWFVQSIDRVGITG